MVTNNINFISVFLVGVVFFFFAQRAVRVHSEPNPKRIFDNNFAIHSVTAIVMLSINRF